jgi:hypothetical protein
MKARIVTILTALCLLSALTRGEQAPKYEFRAAWVATVLQLDWPTFSTVSSQQSQP